MEDLPLIDIDAMFEQILCETPTYQDASTSPWAEYPNPAKKAEPFRLHEARQVSCLKDVTFIFIIPKRRVLKLFGDVTNDRAKQNW